MGRKSISNTQTNKIEILNSCHSALYCLLIITTLPIGYEEYYQILLNLPFLDIFIKLSESNRDFSTTSTILVNILRNFFLWRHYFCSCIKCDGSRAYKISLQIIETDGDIFPKTGH